MVVGALRAEAGCGSSFNIKKVRPSCEMSKLRPCVK
jgi:hypothetical protein